MRRDHAAPASNCAQPYFIDDRHEPIGKPILVVIFGQVCKRFLLGPTETNHSEYAICNGSNYCRTGEQAWFDRICIVIDRATHDLRELVQDER